MDNACPSQKPPLLLTEAFHPCQPHHPVFSSSNSGFFPTTAVSLASLCRLHSFLSSRLFPCLTRSCHPPPSFLCVDPESGLNFPRPPSTHLLPLLFISPCSSSALGWSYKGNAWLATIAVTGSGDVPAEEGRGLEFLYCGQLQGEEGPLLPIF